MRTNEGRSTAGMEAMSRRRGGLLAHVLGAILIGAGALILLTTSQYGASSAAQPALRSGQSATLLPSGKYLLLGGLGVDDQPLDDAWIFDSRTGQQVQAAGRLSVARADHSATLLPDGRVLVVGGVGLSGHIVSQAEVFDIVTGSFQTAPAAPAPRIGHAAALLTDGRLLLAGGVDQEQRYLGDAEVWNPRTGRGVSLPPDPNLARRIGGARLLTNGSVLLIGGWGSDGHAVSNALTFRPEDNRFEVVGNSEAAQLLSVMEQAVVPQLVASIPAAGTDGFPIDGQLVVRFAGPVDVSTATSLTIVLVGPEGQVDSSVVPAQDGMLVFVSPRRELIPNASYTLFVDGIGGRTGIKHALEAVDFKTSGTRGSDVREVPPGTEEPDRNGSIPATTPTRPGAPMLSTGADDADDDEVFLPGEQHRGGRWRTGRPLPDSVKALFDLDVRFHDKIMAQRARATRSGVDLKPSALLFAPRYSRGSTGVAGVVLRLNDRPLSDATISIGTRTVRTDGHGRFELTGIPPGHHVMHVDGTSAGGGGRHYAEFSYGVDVKAGEVTELVNAIYLPRVREKDWVAISAPARSDAVVTHPNVPGLEVHIPRGAVLRDRQGRIVTRIAIVAVPVDRTPFPLPVDFPMYYMVQPSGTIVQGLDPRSTKGIRLVYPNQTHEKPGTELSYWQYDPAEYGWRVYGSAHISDDGSKVVPDAGTYLPQNMLAAYHPSIPNRDNGEPTNCGKSAGDPVDCSSGVFLHSRKEVELRGFMPISLTRTYRSLDPNKRAFGNGMSHEYDMYISSAAGTYGSDMTVVFPDGQQYKYIYNTPKNQFENFTTPGRFYGSVVKLGEAVATGVGGWDLILRDGTVYRFWDHSGVLYSIRDRHGNAISTVRSGGLLQRLYADNGRYLEFTYDASGRVATMSDISGRVWNYTYDAAGYMSRATYPDSTYEEYTYDTSGNMLTVRDRRGNTMVTNVYDANGRVQQQTLADDGVFRFAYTTDANGRVTQTDITDPRGFVNRATFNAAGYLLTDTFALGQPEQQTRTIERQAGTNFVLSETDALGRKTDYTYDALGNVTSVTRMAGTAAAATDSFTYDPAYSQVTSHTNAADKKTTYTYNIRGQLASISDPLNHKRVELTYNDNGQPLTIQDGAGQVTTLGYDLGDLVSVTDPLNRVTSYYPDMLGRVLSVTDPAWRKTLYEYNALDQVTGVTDPQNRVTRIAWDPLGNLLTVTDPQNGVHQHTYDAKNRLRVRTDPLNRLERFEYDGNDNLLRQTDKMSRITDYSYDAVNRRTRAEYGKPDANGTPESSASYTYDAANRLTQASDTAGGTVTRAYNDLTRTYTETTAQGSVTYVQDALNRRVRMTVAGQDSVNYSYDDASRLTGITRGSDSVGFTYDAASRRATLTLPSGIVANYSYDGASQLTGITYKQGATTLGDLVYEYDLTGNRTRVTGSLAHTGLPSPLTTATYNAANQLTSRDGTAITYDDNGNMRNDGTRTYTWDARNRLIAIGGAVVASFTYDAFGRRTGKTVNGTSTSYLYDDLNPVQELNGATPTANLLTGLHIDEFFRRTDSAGARDLMTDALGTVLALADDTGAVQTRYSYEPFGNTTASGAGSTNPFQYTGRENDGTGLYYYRARYYHPTLQRFISSDPIGIDGGLNTYSYVSNNPLRYVDPLGLAETTITSWCRQYPAACAEMGEGAAAGSRGRASPIPVPAPKKEACDKDDGCKEAKEECHPICVGECVGRGKGSDAPACYRKCMRACLPSHCADNY